MKLIERRISRFQRDPLSVRNAVGVIVTSTAAVVEKNPLPENTTSGLAPFVHQICVHRIFLVHGDKFLLRASPHVRSRKLNVDFGPSVTSYLMSVRLVSGL